MRKYRDTYYEITETDLNYIIEFYDDTKIKGTRGYVEISKAGMIGETDLDDFARECIDDEYMYMKGWN